MKFQNILFLAVIAMAFMVTSCDDSISLQEDALIHVPATTSSVTAINVKRLMDKADFKEVIQMPFYKDMVKKAEKENPGIASVLNDPYTSGVNLDANAYMIQDIDLNNPDQQFVAIVVSLSDKDAFKKLVTSNGGDVKSGDEFDYIAPNSSNGNGIIAWTNDLAVMGGSSGRMDYKGIVAKYFSTTKETSIASNKNLQKVFSKDADFTSWVSSDNIAEQAKKSMGMEMAMAGFTAEMLTGNYGHSYGNFNDGEFVMNSEYTINKELASEFRHIFKDEVNTDFSKFLPGKNLSFAVSGALDIKGINMILESKGVNGILDMQLREFDLTAEKLAKTFDGDFVVCGYYESGNSNPEILIGTKINDRELFDKILALGEEHGMVTKIKSGLYSLNDVDRSIGSSLGYNPHLAISKDMIFISGNANMLEQINSGGFSKSDRIEKKAVNVLNDNIFGLFVDFKGIQKMMQDEENINIDALDDLILRMDRDDATFKVEMKDKKTNSLKSMIQWLNKTYEEQQIRDKAM